MWLERRAMFESEPVEAPSAALKKWVEPEVRSLDVKGTRFLPNTGADGDPSFPDSTRS
jgi:hypothetical protein